MIKVTASVAEVVAGDSVAQQLTVDEVAESAAQQITPAVERDTKYYITSNVYSPDSVSFVISGTKAIHAIAAGETLTRIALRYYGTKNLWPYIVKHNPVAIKNPDSVPLGTVIEVPELIRK